MMPPEDDRRIEDARAIGTMAEQIRNLTAAVDRIERGQAALITRLDEQERRGADTCRDCSSWARISALEQTVVVLRDRIEIIKDHEARLRHIEPKMAAAAAVISAGMWLLSKVV